MNRDHKTSGLRFHYPEERFWVTDKDLFEDPCNSFNYTHETKDTAPSHKRRGVISKGNI